MNMSAGIVALAAALCAGLSAANAQQIEWKQTLNLPKGLNMPQGVLADILGIELGETYPSARARLEAIQREANLPDRDRNLRETKIVFDLPRPGGGAIEAAYIGGVLLKLDRSKSAEHIEIRFSAPSSGHQVMGVRRQISYDSQQEQPRTSELLANLKAKYKSEPRSYRIASNHIYVFQYNDGRVFNPPGANFSTCRAQAFTASGYSQAYVKEVNEDGTCDVVLRIEIRPGISDDHIASVEFWLSDNERTKRNLAADFAFFEGYVRQLQNRSGGAAPKL